MRRASVATTPAMMYIIILSLDDVSVVHSHKVELEEIVVDLLTGCTHLFPSHPSGHVQLTFGYRHVPSF